MPNAYNLDLSISILNADISDQLYRKCLQVCGMEEYAQDEDAYRETDCQQLILKSMKLFWFDAS